MCPRTSLLTQCQRYFNLKLQRKSLIQILDLPFKRPCRTTLTATLRSKSDRRTQRNGGSGRTSLVVLGLMTQTLNRTPVLSYPELQATKLRLDSSLIFFKMNDGISHVQDSSIAVELSQWLMIMCGIAKLETLKTPHSGTEADPNQWLSTSNSRAVMTQVCWSATSQSLIPWLLVQARILERVWSVRSNYWVTDPGLTFIYKYTLQDFKSIFAHK